MGWWFARADFLELISMKRSWSRPRRVLPALLVASLVPVLSAVPALAVTGTWAPHVALSPPGPYPVNLISEPAVGMDASGGAVSVFVPANAGTTIAAAFRASGATWSRAVRISPPGETGNEPDVAVAPDGTAVAAWSAYRGGIPAVEVAFRAPGGSFGAPVAVSSGQRSLGVQAGIDSNDPAVVLFTLIDGSNPRAAYAVTRPPGGVGRPTDPFPSAPDAPPPPPGAGARSGLGSPTVLSPSAQDAALADLGVGAGGRAVVAWQVASSDPNAGGAGAAINAVRFTPGGGWSAPQVVATGTALWNPSTGVDTAGDAVVAWTSGTSTAQTTVRLATAGPSGAWTTARTVSGATGTFRTPDVALDGAGDAVVAWQTELASRSTRIDAVTRRGASGGFSAPITISAGDGNAVLPRAAAAPDGSIEVVSWFDAAASVARVTTTAPAQAFAAPVTLDRAQTGAAVGIAAGSGGRAAAAWNEALNSAFQFVIAASTFG